MSKDTLRQAANILSVIQALTVNILASALPLNGQNTGEISDRFKVYFVPAGYVFAIWGVIYIGWIAFAIYQALPAQKMSPRLRRLGYLFALSGVFNAAWLFCWHYNRFGLSVLVVLGLLGLLIASYLRLDVGRSRVSAAEKWCVDIPFSVYLGWLSIATIANISLTLVASGWDGFGIAAETWAVLIVAVALVLTLLMLGIRKDIAYALVVIWALVGISVNQTNANVVLATQVGAVIAAIATVAIAVLLVVKRK
jgi:hypothetical protein